MAGYRWRRITKEEREQLLAWRKANARPWHTPPHRFVLGRQYYHVTAACYEHASIIGASPDRLDQFTKSLLELLEKQGTSTIAWCVLPNHYHVLIQTGDVMEMLKELGKFHGRTSFKWNRDDDARGRQVFHGAVERFMRSERHTRATLNYVHHNPVHHGYVARWTGWRWSSAGEYLERTGRDEAERVWREYPIGSYGKGWDDPEL